MPKEEEAGTTMDLKEVQREKALPQAAETKEGDEEEEEET